MIVHVHILAVILNLAQQTSIVPEVSEPLHQVESSPTAGQGDDIVVYARRESLRENASAIDYFRKYRFDALRLERKVDLPDVVVGWTPLEPGHYAKFGIGDDNKAYRRVSSGTHDALVLTINHKQTPKKINVATCQVIAIGGREHQNFRKDMSQRFDAQATNRHVGLPFGTPRTRGWSQLGWFALPKKNSTAWKAYRFAQDKAQSAFVMPETQSAFYQRSDFVVGGLSQKRDGQTPISFLSLAYHTQHSD